MPKKIAKFMFKHAGWSYSIMLALAIGAYIAFECGMLPLSLVIVGVYDAVCVATFVLWCIALYAVITDRDGWKE